MHRQIRINNPHYIPTLYREKLIELVDDEGYLIEGLRSIDLSVESDDLDFLFHFLADLKTAYLKACYQEGLLLIDELVFFLGFTDEVPSIVGGEAPYLSGGGYQ